MGGIIVNEWREALVKSKEIDFSLSLEGVYTCWYIDLAH